MTLTGNKWTFGGGHAAQWAVLASIVAACVASRIIRHVLVGKLFFWDYWVYDATIASLRVGADPYVGHNFTYPPIAVDILEPLTSVGPSVLMRAYAILFGASALWLLWLLARTVCGSLSPFQRACALVAGIAAFTTAGTLAFSSANFGVIQNAIILTGLIYALRSRSYLPFFLAVILCSSIKPFYLQFLIVPIVVNREGWPYILKSGAVVVATAAIYLWYYYFSEASFVSWIRSITDVSIAQGVPGDNVFGFALQNGASSIEAMAIHGLFCLAMLIMALRLKSVDEGVRLSVALIVASFLNPRIMAYDVQIAAIPVFYLISNMAPIQSRMRPATGALLTVVLLFGLGMLSVKEPELVAKSIAFPLTALATVALAYFGLARPERQRKIETRASALKDGALQAVPASHPMDR